MKAIPKKRLMPAKTWLQAVKKSAVTFQVAYHVIKKYDSWQSYNKLAKMSHAKSDWYLFCPGKLKKGTISKASQGMPHVLSRS